MKERIESQQPVIFKSSKCCGAEIIWKESGVSQLSFDVSKTCSKCGKELKLEVGDI